MNADAVVIGSILCVVGAVVILAYIGVKVGREMNKKGHADQ